MAEYINVAVRLDATLEEGATGSLYTFETDIQGGKTKNREVRTPMGSRRGKWMIGIAREHFSQGQVDNVMTIFAVSQGPRYGFLFKAPEEYKSCRIDQDETALANAQTIGTGDGSDLTFQLIKKRTLGQTHTFTVYWPRSGTVKIWVNDTLKTESSHYNVDYTTGTGVVTFTGGNAPGNGLSVKAGFQFDMPVRFDNESLDPTMIYDQQGGIRQITLRELLPTYTVTP